MRVGVTSPVYINNNYHKQFLDWMSSSIYSEIHELFFIPVENYINPQMADFDYFLPQGGVRLHQVPGRQPQAVSKGWNDGIQAGIDLGCEYILVANDDIIFKINAIDKLVAFAEAHKEACLWSMGTYTPQGADLADVVSIKGQLNLCAEDDNFNEHPNFACFMVHKSFFETPDLSNPGQVLGKFDENIVPAYHEDNDMHARIVLSGNKAYVYGGAWIFHYGSRTINTDAEYQIRMGPMFEKGRGYFMGKWGCGVINEPTEMANGYFKHPYNEEDKPLSYWRPIE